MAKEIPLTQGKVAIVDDEDYAYLSQFKWHAHVKSRTCSYPQRGTSRLLGKQKMIAMHEDLCKAPAGMVVDHINGNGLDNRRCNLRIITQRQNSQNMIAHRQSRSLVGAYWKKSSKAWVAQIRIDGKKKYLGRFPSQMAAHEAYKAACEQIGTTVISHP